MLPSRYPTEVPNNPPSIPPLPYLVNFSSLFHTVHLRLTLGQVFSSIPPFKTSHNQISDTTSETPLIPFVATSLTSVRSSYLPPMKPKKDELYSSSPFPVPISLRLSSSSLMFILSKLLSQSTGHSFIHINK